MIKKTIASLLAAILLAASLGSCAVPSGTAGVSANIRLTSSDAESAGAWLTERLGDKLTDRVALRTEADCEERGRPSSCGTPSPRPRKRTGPALSLIPTAL